MRRFTTLVLALALVLVTVAPAAAAAGRTESFSIHGGGGVAAASDTLRVGSGAVARLGRSTIEQTQVFTGWDGTDPFTLLGNAVTGDVTFVAANGDELYGSYVGEVDYLAVPPGWELPVVLYLGELTFTGGTGRFVGATGTAWIDGGHCFNVGRGYFEILGGTITLPK